MPFEEEGGDRKQEEVEEEAAEEEKGERRGAWEEGQTFMTTVSVRAQIPVVNIQSRRWAFILFGVSI